MTSIVTEGMKTPKYGFGQVARFRPPVRQGSGFGFRRATRRIKRVLTVSLCLLFLNQTGNETAILTFS